MTDSTLPTVNPNAAFQNNVQAPAAQAPVTPAPQQQSPSSLAIQTPQTPVNTPTSQNLGIGTTPTTTVNVNTAPQTSQDAPGSTQSQNTSQTLPSTNLHPGAQGQDVQQLQNYLVQHGYLTAEQIGNGAGTYGPQTTAAVAKLQGDLGINPTTGSGYYGPQTQSALAQKYGNIFNTVQNQQAPDQAGVARAAIDSAYQAQESATTDPVFGAMASSMGPIMQSLTQVLNNINNPALTAVSLQSEYQQMAQQYQIPQLQSSMLNMQNVMNGTTNDIRDEITKAGGTATESQVQAMSAARNNVILKQYNALSTQYQAAATNVQNMMQYASTDQSNALQRQNMTANITESMASIQNQMLQMGMTMQNNARSAAQYNVTQMGYQGVAASAQGNPQILSAYENLLGLAPGSLSDPAALATMDTYKNQQLQLNNYKALVQAYNVGFNPTNPTGSTGQYGTATSTISQITGYDPNTPLSQIQAATLVPAIIKNEGSSPQGVVNNPGNIKFAGLPGQINSGISASDGGTFASYSSAQAGQQAIATNIQNAIQSNPNQTLGSFIDRYTNTAPTNALQDQVGITPVDPTTLVRPPSVAANVPLTMSADQMQHYMSTQKAAATIPYSNDVQAPGIGTYLHQADGSYVLADARPSPIDTQYNTIKQTIASAPPFSGSPKVTSQWTTTTNKELSAFKDLGTYKVLSTVAPYMANIRAAQVNPGSISDLELLDSYVRLSKGGTGQVTGDQVDIALKGASIGDSSSVMEQKLQNGGVLSPNQRDQLVQLASEVYNENSNDFKKIYVAATQSLQANGVPTSFWRQLPDLNSLLSSNQ